jgi:hypothetical protein
MSLHQATAAAIGEAHADYCDCECQKLAAAAIGVVLAGERQRLHASIEADDPTSTDDWALLLNHAWRDMRQWVPDDVAESAWETFHNAMEGAIMDGKAAALALVERDAAKEES